MRTSNRNSQVFSIGFFLCLIFLGLLIFRDYGISLDEPAQRLIGIVNLNYVSEVLGIKSILANPHFADFTTQTLMQLEDRHYGVIYEIPAAFIEVFFKTENIEAIYQTRHLLNFLYFIFGLAAIYKIAMLRFQDWRISLLTCVLIIFSPRIFSDAFYNDKDIVFLSMYAIASLTMIQFSLNPSLKWSLIHGLFSAIAVDTRLVGIIFPALTLLIYLIRLRLDHRLPQNKIAVIGSYLVVCAMFIIILWPYMWSNPISHFIEAFKYISRHPHSAAVLFQGKDVLTNELPWYYLPLWIGISTPILYLGLFICGFIAITANLIKEKLNFFIKEDLLIDSIFICLFAGPICLVAISHTSIYNGWRHLYFVYPFFILISTKGLIEIWKKLSHFKFSRIIIISTVCISLGSTGQWMFINHPLQNLYFNTFAGKNWISSYEADYWGLAHRIALQKILKVADTPVISIWPGTNSKFKSGEPTVFTDQIMLEPATVRSKIISPESIEDSEYVIASRIGNYSSEYLSQHGMFKKIDSVNVDNNEIIGIFQQKKYENILPVKPSNVILFTRNQEGIFYLYGNKNPPINWELWNSSEWYSPESWGSWAKGTHSSIDIETSREQLSKVSMRLRGFVSPKNSSQSAEVWINGIFIENFIITDDKSKEFIFSIPKKNNVDRGHLRIELKNMKPVSPKNLGISQDGRGLSIGLESIILL
jgi:uncharacterized membrane protein YuzA (DUF378 family)